MKASLAYGLDHIGACYNPTTTDCWLVAPADMPGFRRRSLIGLSIKAADRPEWSSSQRSPAAAAILFCLPWSLAAEVQQLAENEGLNTLIDRQTPRLVAVRRPGEPTASRRFADIDTPADLAAFANSKPPPAN